MKKGYKLDTHRVCDPKITVKNVLEKLKSSLIWDDENVSLYQIGNLDVFNEYVYCVSSYVGKRNNWGKGLTKYQAMASALMEFCERYSWYKKIYEVNDSEQKTHNEIESKKINVDELILTDNDRERFSKIDFYNDVKYNWIEGYSLTNSEKKLIPWYEQEFLTTNCLGAGNTLEEAIIHAIYETIERHNYNVMMANYDIPKIINIDTITNSNILNLIEKIKSFGFEIYIMDCSFDFGVHTIGALIYNGKYQYVSHYAMNLHMGTHSNKDIAIIRALTEIIQNRATNIDNNKFDISRIKKEDYMYENDLSPITNFYLSTFRTGKTEVINYNDLKDTDTDDMSFELSYIVEDLKNNGFEVLVIDITDEKLDVKCVRVVIPGLQPMIFELFDDLSSKDIRFSKFIKR
ncbi:MAG: YcaO-like family protein [Candidatus Gracilibacteria bacterium]|nr:YcaO-like family protein [Candidatus Gracilibacteria bacterium]